jgi:predicted transcriptional regulator
LAQQKNGDDMARTLDDVLKALPLDQQQEVATQAARLIEDGMTLRDLRKAQAGITKDEWQLGKIEAGLAAADRGDFASDDEVARVRRQFERER